MLGSHDSYTYLDCKSSMVNNFSRYWRTQTLSITDQYKMGVRFFDVRVIREPRGDDRNSWRVCHGLAECTKVFSSLTSLCSYFKVALPGSKLRVWLEKGTEEDWLKFIEEIEPLIIKHQFIWQVVRKKPETVFYRSPHHPRLEDYTYENWGIKSIIKHLNSSPILEHAKKNNPKITKKMIEDPNVIYFLDFIEYGFPDE